MALRMTTTEAKRYGLAKLKGSAKKARRADGYDSQLEADYAAWLAVHPRVKRWQYHPWQFILVPGLKPVRYTPDFLVILHGHTAWEIHETKGYWRPKDRVIMKLCADRWPEFRIFGVMRVHGQWELEAF